MSQPLHNTFAWGCMFVEYWVMPDNYDFCYTTGQIIWASENGDRYRRWRTRRITWHGGGRPCCLMPVSPGVGWGGKRLSGGNKGITVSRFVVRRWTSGKRTWRSRNHRGKIRSLEFISTTYSQMSLCKCLLKGSKRIQSLSMPDTQCICGGKGNKTDVFMMKGVAAVFTEANSTSFQVFAAEKLGSEESLVLPEVRGASQVCCFHAWTSLMKSLSSSNNWAHLCGRTVGFRSEQSCC